MIDRARVIWEIVRRCPFLFSLFHFTSLRSIGDAVYNVRPFWLQFNLYLGMCWTCILQFSSSFASPLFYDSTLLAARWRKKKYKSEAKCCDRRKRKVMKVENQQPIFPSEEFHSFAFLLLSFFPRVLKSFAERMKKETENRRRKSVRRTVMKIVTTVMWKCRHCRWQFFIKSLTRA